MNYYVVSPNVYNDGYNYAQKMFSKKIAAVGWDTDRPKGQQFDSIMQGDCIIVAQRINWQWTYYYMGIVSENEDEPSFGALSKRLSPIISLDGIDLDFDNWTANGSNQVPSPQRIDINSNIDIIEKINKILNMQKYIDLLKSNHNLILTGAPGTGKTYLAKEIAKAMGCSENEIDFVQFHPSYDYTDFVEGLRPKGDDGNIGFERKDGVFKAFCEKAKKNLLDAKKTEKQLQIELSWDEKVITFLNDSIEKQSEYPLTNGGNVMIENYHEDIVDIILPHNAIHKSDKIHISKLLKILNAEQTFDKAIEVERYLRDYHSAEYSYLLAIYQAIKKYSFNTSNLIPEKTEKKDFVFIIDEINRGEISKIFGELFFSIDPGYRGTDGIVKSQYQNLVPMNSAFAEGFYVPENVYIIGTMNDIDRSVESMDFAFRRRFAFKEIKSKDRVEMLYDTENGIGEYAEKAKNRMIHLNEEIEKIEGLSSAYHIGPAYFLKLKNYDGDFSKLWEYHLEGLLREYLRGMQDVEGKIKVLKEAYENENDPDDGQQQ